MPQINKARSIGSVGDGTPMSPLEESTSHGVPDVQFSDTSLTIFAEQFLVDASWNMPIFGFGNASINIQWFNASDTQVQPPAGGFVTVYFTPGSNSSSVALEFPPNTEGKVRIEVRRRSVVSALDNNTPGPPQARAFEVLYDTTEDFGSDVGAPATLTLSEPPNKGSGTWRLATYTQKFYWSKPVGGFESVSIGSDADDDIRITVAGANSTATPGTLVQDSSDNRVYSLPITFSGSATYQIRVNPNIVTSGGSKANNAPPSEVSTSWAFNVETGDFIDSSVTKLCTETIPLTTNHPELGTDEKGMFLGASDMIVANSKVYFTSQIQHKRASNNELSTLRESAGAFVSVPTSGGTCTVHKKYAHFRKAARSPVAHLGSVYFFEGSAYVYAGSAQPNYTLASIGEGMGFIYRISSAGTISEVGLNWRSGFPTGKEDRYNGAHLGTMSPMVSYDGDLHMISQKYDFFDISGVQWVVYGEKLNQRVSLLKTNGKTGFAIMEELAALSDSIIGFHDGTFAFKPRKATQAYLSAALTAAATSLTFKNNNRDLGTSGTIMIGDEVLTYTGKTDSTSTLTGLTRGTNSTTAAAHVLNTPIVFMDRVIHATDITRPVNEMDIDVDGSLLSNFVTTKFAEGQVPRSDYMSFSESNAASITKYGERKKQEDLVLDLDYHQSEWAKRISNDYLNRYKEPQKSIRLTLKRDFDIGLADILYFTESVISDTAMLCQIMSIRHIQNREETEVIVVEIEPLPLDS